MAPAALEAHAQTMTRPLGKSWRLLVAARAVVDGGATRAEIAKDLGQLAAHRLSPGELRATLEREMSALAGEGLATESRGRLTLTEIGRAAVFDALGCKVRPAKASWSEIRDIRLVALALGIEDEPPAKLRLLSRPGGLRATVLQRAYKLPLRVRTSPARMRGALAAIALHRAFGNSIDGALGETGEGLSAKAARLLAGQLAQKPRDFGTDGRLIAVLAAQCAGSVQVDADAVRMALLRTLVSAISAPVNGVRPSAATTAPAKTAATLQPAMPKAAPARPDLGGFARKVQEIARSKAEGWPGNRKAYISDVWQVLKLEKPEWGLTEIEFKGMLAEAHRTGHIALANADLKDRQSLPRVQQSAVPFKNSVLHLVRVAD